MIQELSIQKKFIKEIEKLKEASIKTEADLEKVKKPQMYCVMVHVHFLDGIILFTIYSVITYYISDSSKIYHWVTHFVIPPN